MNWIVGFNGGLVRWLSHRRQRQSSRAINTCAKHSNVTGAVAPIAAMNNYLLPAFMIILGVAFVRWTAVPGSPGA